MPSAAGPPIDVQTPREKQDLRGEQDGGLTSQVRCSLDVELMDVVEGMLEGTYVTPRKIQVQTYAAAHMMIVHNTYSHANHAQIASTKTWNDTVLMHVEKSEAFVDE